MVSRCPPLHLLQRLDGSDDPVEDHTEVSVDVLVIGHYALLPHRASSRVKRKDGDRQSEVVDEVVEETAFLPSPVVGGPESNQDVIGRELPDGVRERLVRGSSSPSGSRSRHASCLEVAEDDGEAFIRDVSRP